MDKCHPRLDTLRMGAPEPDPRKRVDLSRLPRWLQYVLALAVVAVVVILALTSNRPGTAAGLFAAVGAALIAFAVIAWRVSRKPPGGR